MESNWAFVMLSTYIISVKKIWVNISKYLKCNEINRLIDNLVYNVDAHKLITYLTALYPVT